MFKGTTPVEECWRSDSKMKNWYPAPTIPNSFHLYNSPISLNPSATMPDKKIIKTAARKRAPPPLKKPKLEEEEENDIEDFSRAETDEIRVSLLKWYDQNQRVVPWRITSEEEKSVGGGDENQRAYGVWVSEVMLQQTRVSTVIDYYKRWMEKWPTIHHLARASQEEVNEIWAGLGYYRRARFLLQGAKTLVGANNNNTTQFPTSISALRLIPGIGQYTAGAIASIAFNQAVPVVDGNVIRVLARLKAISANPKAPTTTKSFWKLAGQLVDPCRPGDFNQALMELGATLCTVSSPSCSTCPISGQCRAFSLSRAQKSILVTDYPTKVQKTKPRLEFSAVCVVEIWDSRTANTAQGTQRNNVFLLVKRPEEGLLAGLWEFPSVLMDGEADLTIRRETMDRYLKKSFKLDMKKKHSIFSRDDVGQCVHIFSHIRLQMYVELLVLHLEGGATFLCDKEEHDGLIWKCIDSESIQSIGLTSGVRKVYTMIEKFKKNQLLSNTTSSKRKKISRNHLELKK